jgi:hypothetical protein
MKNQIARAKGRRSALEETLAMQLKAAGLLFKREFVFAEPRKFRFDFLVWKCDGPEVAVECEGGVFSGGRHTRGAGFLKDCEKYNLAAEVGYHVLRYTMADIKSGAALAQIERVLKQES